MKKNHRLKAVLLGMLACMVFFSAGQGQGWHVKKFSADIQLNVDGSFDVTENILVEFEESKRGIIRTLPFRYAQSFVKETELAEGHAVGEDYITPIRNISVEGWNYEVESSAYEHRIKIGKSDEYLSGEQRYVIQYKVYGAINHFKNSQEFYWNVNGNDWDVAFDATEVTVKLPDERRMPPSDIAAFTGLVGSSQNLTTTAVLPGVVTIATTRPLAAKEGLTVVMRFPKGYLRNDPIPMSVRAENYVIDSVVASMRLDDKGWIDVDETIGIEVIHPQHPFLRTLQKQYYYPLFEGVSAAAAVQYELQACTLKQRGYKERNAFPSISGFDAGLGAFQVQIDGASFQEAGNYEIHLQYRVWNAAMKGEKGAALYLPWLDQRDHEPIASSRLDFYWAEPQKADLQNVKLHNALPSNGVVLMEPTHLRLTFPEAMQPSNKVHLALRLPNEAFTWTPPPLHVYQPSEYFQFYDVELDLQADGNLHVQNRFGMYRDAWYERVSRPITLAYDDWRLAQYEFARPQSWGRRGKYLYKNLQCEGELINYAAFTDHHLELWGPRMLKYDGSDTLQYSYDIFGMVKREGPGSVLRFMLIEQTDNVIDRIHFRVHFPGDQVLEAKDILLKSFSPADTLLIRDAKLQFRPGEIMGEIPTGMFSNRNLMLELRLPSGVVSGSFFSSLHLLWINHKTIFMPLILLIPLLLAWFIAGRDRSFTTVVEFYPPEDLTPTEAGFLIDDKLHNRDLLALIYWWGAQGLITIKEIYDADGKANDYEFTQLKKLPSGARKYEKTIFNALFASGNTTKVSSYKEKFHGYMTQARAEVDELIKRKNFYVPGTVAWAFWIKFLGWLLVLIGLVLGGFVLFQFSSWMEGRWEIPLGWMGSGILMIFFGGIMPKKAPIGHATYQKLYGFREFILRAEKEKLEQLLDTNPDYFGMTLPYAIALGIATKWVSKFGALLTAPPSYYQVNQTNSNFQLSQFDQIMQRQLDQMANSFNSTPPPPKSSGGGGGSSGGSSYSSSSSYSSHSSSGGSGFSSGGGYSGGGYGGGGGSAW